MMRFNQLICKNSNRLYTSTSSSLPVKVSPGDMLNSELPLTKCVNVMLKQSTLCDCTLSRKALYKWQPV